MSIVFKDFSPDVIKKINQLGYEWLEEASGELEAQVKRNTKVDTGRTKASWEHKVDGNKLEAQVGSRYQNAIWEEFGTGIYAEGGKGRKDVPWTYKDAKDKWHKTKGKKPRKPFRNAYDSMKNKLIKSAQRKFRSIK